jgi:hypothetical protein
MRGALFGGATALAVAIATAVILAVAAGLLWAFGVFSSGPGGAGNVTRDRNSATNREHWSATYNGDFQQVKADRDQLAALKAAADAPGATQQDRTDYTGARLNCVQDVAAYNADAANTLGHRWIPSGLPDHLTTSTYCGS